MAISQNQFNFQVLFVALIFAVSFDRAAMGGDSVSITPDATVQKRFAALSNATGANDEDELRFFKQIIALRRLAEKDPKELCRQLIWYQAHTAKESDFTVVFILSYVPNLNKRDIVSAIAPLIGQTSDTKIDFAARSILSLMDATVAGVNGRIRVLF